MNIKNLCAQRTNSYGPSFMNLSGFDSAVILSNNGGRVEYIPDDTERSIFNIDSWVSTEVDKREYEYEYEIGISDFQ